MTVRPLLAGDEAAWRPLWQGYCAFYGEMLDEAVTRHLWQALLDPARSPHGRVLER